MKYLLISLVFFQSAHAALPPLWQSTKEIKAILDDPQFGSSLQSGEEIQKIKRTEGGWLIVTNKNHLLVKVIPKPQANPGPKNFALEFGKASAHE